MYSVQYYIGIHIYSVPPIEVISCMFSVSLCGANSAVPSLSLRIELNCLFASFQDKLYCVSFHVAWLLITTNSYHAMNYIIYSIKVDVSKHNFIHI